MESLAAKEVIEYFDSKDLTIKLVEEDLIKSSWGFDGGDMDIFVQFIDDDERAHVEGINFIKVPMEKRDRIIPIINQVNSEYCFVKFVLNTNSGQICARLDTILGTEKRGEVCYELVMRTLNVVEDAYPQFMKAIWSQEQEGRS